MKSLTSKPFQALFPLLLTVIWHSRSVSSVQCYSERRCDVGLLGSLNSSRECCVGTETGVSFDIRGESEHCFTCEVIGWKEPVIYATANSDVVLEFGNRKGIIAARYRFQLQNISNGADVSFNSNDLETFDFIGEDVEVLVRVPPSSEEERYIERNTTFNMTLLLPEPNHNQFIHPQLVVIHVIVPEVEFEGSSHTLRYPEDTLPLCLSYSNTEGAAEFTVRVSISQTDGPFSTVIRYNFTRDSARLCEDISLPVADLDPLQNTSFIASVKVSDDPDQPSVFDVGSMDTTTITVLAIEPPVLQFHEQTLFTLTFPPSSIDLCLAYTAADGVYLPFEAEVTLFKQEGNGKALVTRIYYQFTDNDSVSCQNMNVPPSSLDQFMDAVFVAVIEDQPNAVFKIGDQDNATITVAGLQVSQVAFQAERYQFSDSVFSFEVCLVRSMIPDKEEGPFNVTVSLTSQENSPSRERDYVYTFSGNESLACQNITVAGSSIQFDLDIVTPLQPLFQVGSPSRVLIVSEGFKPTDKPGTRPTEKPIPPSLPPTFSPPSPSPSPSPSPPVIKVEHLSGDSGSGISPAVIALSVIIPVIALAIATVAAILGIMRYKRHKLSSSPGSIPDPSPEKI